MKERSEDGGRKEYHPPKLVVHGKVSELTQGARYKAFKAQVKHVHFRGCGHGHGGSRS